MLISIIVPAYNAEPFLAATVKGVLAQNFLDWELILVNDGSRDRTGEIALALAEQDARIRVVQQENAGMAAARNAGFQRSDTGSRYLMFLDSDDVLEPDALQGLVATLENNPDCVAAHGKPHFINSEGELIQCQHLCEQPSRYASTDRGVFFEPTNGHTTLAHLVVQNVILTPGLVLIRRENYAKAGAFDQTIYHCADWDMWLRLAQQGNIARLEQITLAYRLHSNNHSKQIKGLRNHEFECVRKAFVRAADNPQQRKIIVAGYRKHQMIYFHSKIKIAVEELKRVHLLTALRQCAYGMNHLVLSFRNMK